MSGGTINLSFFVGDKVKRSEEYLKSLPIVEARIVASDESGEILEVAINRDGVTYYVKWPPNMYNPRGYYRGYDADDLESAE